MADAQVVRRGRGFVLIHDRYMYQRNQTRPHCIYWRCCINGCASKVRTNVFQDNNIILQNIPLQHNHEPEAEVIERNAVIREMIQAIQANPTLAPRRVYDDVLNNENNILRDNVPSFGNVRSILQRARTAVIPPIPLVLDDVIVEGEWCNTWRGERLLLENDRERGTLVFATDTDLRQLARCTTIFADGTFKSSPVPYTQFFTIHGAVSGHIVKLACGLLANKNADSYAHVFQLLKYRVFMLTGRPLSPTNVVTDFELAIIRALQQEFPNIQIDGCFFHFSKAIWRKVQEMGLAMYYRGNAVFKDLVKKIMALGFLPIHSVQNAYLLLRNDPLTIRVIENLRPLGAIPAFFDYFENTWLNNGGPFPPAMWNVHTRPMEYRTNNHVESFHRRWNKKVNERHPSLWVFLRVMKNEQRVHEITLRNALNGVPPPRRRLRWRRLEERIVNLRVELQNQQRNVIQYWRAVSYAVAEFV